jgi:hypothetical protein
MRLMNLTNENLTMGVNIIVREIRDYNNFSKTRELITFGLYRTIFTSYFRSADLHELNQPTR